MRVIVSKDPKQLGWDNCLIIQLQYSCEVPINVKIVGLMEDPFVDYLLLWETFFGQNNT